ncbi:hypothetical protein [Streptomyces sp. NPDC056479]|uniref:hypothetical protein n=1 Tax=unclassified Streptomyces TaxID=2593676 RepID=UPI0036B7C3AE
MTEPPAPDAPTNRLFGARGRHRRPRPRKVLLAAGGLALAAGALSLVRLTPDSGVTGLAAPESDPAPAPGTNSEPDRATNAAATFPTTRPTATPTATSAMGGLGTTPTATTIAVPTGTTAATPPPSSAIPTSADTPPPASPAPATTGAAPRPTPPPARPTPGRPATSPPPAQPTHPDENAVCIPVIGLCVDPLAADD